MSAVSHSPIRHKMLAEVANGKVHRHEFVGIDVVWVNAETNVAYKSNDVRQLNWLWSDGMITVDVPGSEQVILSQDSDALTVLAEWDAEHPEALPEIGGKWRSHGSIVSNTSDLVGAVAIANEHVKILVLPVKHDDKDSTTRVAEAVVARLNGGLES